MVALLCAMACADLQEDPAVPLFEPDGYRLEIVGGPGWSTSMRLALEPDGHFAGYPFAEIGARFEVPYSCNGILEPEKALLTETMNAAGISWRVDHDGGGCADYPTYRFAVQGTGGDAAGISNEFVYDPCDDTIDSIEHLVNVAIAIVDARVQQGDCKGCPEDPLLARYCFDDPASPGDVCKGGESVACDEATAGAVIECSSRIEGMWSLACDPTEGWGAPGG